MADTQVDSGSDISAKVSRLAHLQRGPRSPSPPRQKDASPGSNLHLKNPFVVASRSFGLGEVGARPGGGGGGQEEKGAGVYVFSPNSEGNYPQNKAGGSRHRIMERGCASSAESHCPESNRLRGFFVYTGGSVLLAGTPSPNRRTKHTHSAGFRAPHPRLSSPN